MATLLTIADSSYLSKSRTSSNHSHMVCPLLAMEEYNGRPMPALPVHCVMESLDKHGFESTRRYVLRACDLTHFSHRQDVLSIVHFMQAARNVSRRLARSTRSQKARLMAQPFPFIDFRVPGDEDYHDQYREWRQRRSRKNSTGGSSTDSSDSADESLANLNIKDFVPQDLPTVFDGFVSGTESELELGSENEDEDEVLGDVVNEDEEETEKEDNDDEDDETDLSEGEIDCESDYDHDDDQDDE